MRRPDLVFLAVFLGLLAFACGRGGVDEPREEAPASTPRRAEDAPLPEEPVVFLVGNDRGRIRPCGCSKPLIGGIVRRAALMSKLSRHVRSRSAILAFGNMVETGGRQQELKLEAFLEALDALGASVCVIGDGDLQVGSRFWEDVLTLREGRAMPLVSLNLMRNGKRLFESHATVDYDGETLVVTGLVSPRANKLTEPGIEAAESFDAAAVVRDLKGGSRRLVVWCNAGAADARAVIEKAGLADAAREVIYVLAGISDVPVVNEVSERTVVLEMGTKGRYVGWLDRAGRTLAFRTLTSDLGEDAAAGEVFEFYRSSVRDEGLLLAIPKFGEAEGFYAGSQACARCHEEAHGVWSQSGHARAWKTLEASGDSRDPECVACHVVDFALLGGFDPQTLEPHDVQCEACHGPSAAHVEDPMVPTPRGALGSFSCLQCHDIENSPKFEFDEYWPKISHR